MSSHSYKSTCPKCGCKMDSTRDNSVYDIIYHQCLECGFYIIPKERRLTLTGLNQERKERDLEPLNSLPKIKE